MRPTSILKFCLIPVALCAIFAPVRALAGETGAFLLQWDNDKVVDTDRHYTNGVRMAYTANVATGQSKTTGLTLAKFTRFTDTCNLRTGWALGQDMYTPEDVDAYIPDPMDRPYAGWSYVGFTLQNENGNEQDTLEIDAGMIGPAAHAGQAQNAFHRLINVSISRGWRSQIGDEIGLLATRTYKRRTVAEPVFELDGLEYDFIGHGTAQLGNVRTGAALGATARIGGNLGEDFGPVYGTFALPQKRPNALSYSFFVGAEARAVLWDTFLDGNAFKDSPDVKKEPFIAEARVGFTVHKPLPNNGWFSGVRASINMVHRTREFKTQNKADRYGSLQFTFNF